MTRVLPLADAQPRRVWAWLSDVQPPRSGLVYPDPRIATGAWERGAAVIGSGLCRAGPETLGPHSSGSLREGKRTLCGSSGLAGSRTPPTNAHVRERGRDLNSQQLTSLCLQPEVT